MQRIVYLNAAINASNRDKYSGNELDMKSLNQILSQGWNVKEIVMPGEGRHHAFVLLEQDPNFTRPRPVQES